MFDLRVVRYFVCVARSKSFSRAAITLNVAQPAISRQIKQLEMTLGVDLLHRTTRRLELTAAGKIFLERGEALLARVEEMTAEVVAQGNDSNLSGTVTIGIPPSCTQMLAPQMLSIVKERYPDIRLRIVEGLTLVQEEWLLGGRVDLAVVSDGSTRRGLTLSKLFDEEFVFLRCSLDGAGTEISQAELVEQDLILTKAFRESVERQLNGCVLRCSMEIDSLPALYRMIVSSGQGTILPASLLEDEHLMGRLAARPIAGRPVRRIALARDHKQGASLAVRAIHALFLANLRTCLPDGGRGFTSSQSAPESISAYDL
jgi:LysR family transcriptional regulator, nitrogen assimilation regulatory protein